MKTTVTILLSLGLFTACTVRVADGGGTYPVATKVEGFPQVSAENVTDASQCRFGSTATQLFGRWQVDRQSGNFKSHTVYDFRGGSLSVTNHCEYIGHRMDATVTVPISDDGSAFRTQRGLSHTEYDFDMDCTASVASTRARYWFTGSCLSVQDDATGEILTMIPAVF
jgi:hypothetical protein